MSLLRDRDFLRFFGAQAISMFGDRMVAVALAFAVIQVSSYDWFGSLVLDPLGLAIWGPIAGAIGVDASLWTASGLLLAAAMLLALVPEIRRLPAFPSPEAPACQPRGVRDRL